jgi:hypothetical protein
MVAFLRGDGQQPAGGEAAAAAAAAVPVSPGTLAVAAAAAAESAEDHAAAAAGPPAEAQLGRVRTVGSGGSCLVISETATDGGVARAPASGSVAQLPAVAEGEKEEAGDEETSPQRWQQRRAGDVGRAACEGDARLSGGPAAAADVGAAAALPDASAGSGSAPAGRASFQGVSCGGRAGLWPLSLGLQARTLSLWQPCPLPLLRFSCHGGSSTGLARLHWCWE